jgi:5'-nucleotidase
LFVKCKRSQIAICMILKVCVFADKQLQSGKKSLTKELIPSGAAYYWLTGKFENKDKGEDTDVWALDNGYVSIVPVQFDLTNYHGITFINNNWNIHE